MEETALSSAGTKVDEEGTVGARDRFVLILFAVCIVSVTVMYVLLYRETGTALQSIIGLGLMLGLMVESRDSLNRPIHGYNNPVEEALIVAALYFEWVLLFRFLLPFPEPYSDFFGGGLFGAVIPLYFLSRKCGYDLSLLGLSRKGARRSWRLTGTVCMSLTIAALLRLILAASTPRAMTSELLVAVLIMVPEVAILPGITEEIVFRGVLQPRLTYQLRSRVAGIVLTASIFAALHVFAVFWQAAAFPGDLLFSLLYALTTRLAIGGILSIVWDETGNLTQPIVIHVTNNTLYVLLYAVGVV